MNRETVLAGCPTGDEWQKLHPTKRRDWAVQLISRALTELEKEGREPDAWESNDLGYAIGSLVSGFYAASTVVLERALTPPEMRSPYHFVDTPVLMLRALKLGLAAAAGLPAVGTE